MTVPAAGQERVVGLVSARQGWTTMNELSQAS
jgi:hypothetical protein